MSNYCVCCGDEIPEGRQVCAKCENTNPKISAKEWLMQLKYLDDEIYSLIEARERAFGVATILVNIPTCTKVQTSHQNAMEERFASYAAYEEMINARVNELIDLKTRILSAISEVKNPTYRVILTERYVNQKSFEQIAVIINYNYYHLIKYLHPKALFAVQKHMLKKAAEGINPRLVD